MIRPGVPVARLRATINLLHPDEITPHAQRMLVAICDEAEYAQQYVPKDWPGLRQIIDDLYPADVFTGASGDLGPRLIALLREIDAAKGAQR